MIWALLFALIFASSDSPLVIPKMDNYVKKHVTDKSRSSSMLELIKDDRSQRKALNKAQKSYIKEMKGLNFSRNSSVSDFGSIFEKVMEERRSLQKSDANLKAKAQDYITEDEWTLIKNDAKKDLGKTIKKKNKKITRLAKKFNRFEEDITTIIQDKKRRKQVLESLKSFEKVLFGNIRDYKKYVSDESSLLYAYKVTDDEMSEIINMTNGWRKEIFDSYVETHFSIVGATTQEEWEVIVRKMKKLY